jgi:ABC-type phosphate/phosphonate transport system substrate-binding protein
MRNRINRFAGLALGLMAVTLLLSACTQSTKSSAAAEAQKKFQGLISMDNDRKVLHAKTRQCQDKLIKTIGAVGKRDLSAVDKAKIRQLIAEYNEANFAELMTSKELVDKATTYLTFLKELASELTSEECDSLTLNYRKLLLSVIKDLKELDDADGIINSFLRPRGLDLPATDKEFHSSALNI